MTSHISITMVKYLARPTSITNELLSLLLRLNYLSKSLIALLIVFKNGRSAARPEYL